MKSLHEFFWTGSSWYTGITFFCDLHSSYAAFYLISHMAMLLWGVWQQEKLSLHVPAHVPLKFTVQLTLINLNETVVWVYSTVHTVLKRPWILGEVLENSLSFCASPWKVLEFSLTLNSVAWKVFLMLFFGCPRQY